MKIRNFTEEKIQSFQWYSKTFSYTDWWNKKINFIFLKYIAIWMALKVFIDFDSGISFLRIVDFRNWDVAKSYGKKYSLLWNNKELLATI